MQIKDHIRQIPDFPKPGILFYDISTLLRDADAWQVAMGRMARAVRPRQWLKNVLVLANETVVGQALLNRIRERNARGNASFLIISPQSDRLILLDVRTLVTHTIHGPALAYVTDFAWSPDSTQLLVTGGASSGDCSSLWRVSADGTRETVVGHC